MTEMVVVISIIGVLCTIAVGSYGSFLSGGKDAIAQERQESLNQSLHRFAQQNYELLFNRMDHVVSDEMVVLRTLQFRDPDEDRAQPGSPFFDPRYNPVSSSAENEYRLRWTGRLFELLKPGTAGTGLLLNFSGTDFTTPFQFPPNFEMAGR